MAEKDFSTVRNSRCTPPVVPNPICKKHFSNMRTTRALKRHYEDARNTEVSPCSSLDSISNPISVARISCSTEEQSDPFE